MPVPDLLSVSGRVALVTGAGQGVGRQIALHLAAHDAAAVVVNDFYAERAEAVAAEVEALGPRGLAAPGDVTDFEGVRAMVAAAEAEVGPIDILVNNAGVGAPSPIDLDEEEFERVWALTMAVNLTAHIRLVRACLADLQRNGEGRVVNIASTEGLGASAGMSAYTASKHGVIGLTKGLAVELGRRGITVNAVCPGPIRTGMTAGIPDDAKDKFARRRVPLRRYGDPEEVAQATLSLVLPAMSYVNGNVLLADGGMLAQNT
jgi:3-oxoacyl-[acyl-carrier protein] reductase